MYTNNEVHKNKLTKKNVSFLLNLRLKKISFIFLSAVKNALLHQDYRILCY